MKARRRRLAIVVAFALAGTFLWIAAPALGPATLRSLATGAPHQRYAARLQLQRVLARIPGTAPLWRATGVSLPAAAAVDAWIEAAEQSLVDSAQTAAPFTTQASLTRPGDAVAWRFRVRRGHRIVVTGTFTGGEAFVDLYAAPSAESPDMERTLRNRDYDHLASARPGGMDLTHDVSQDGEVVLRVQPRIGPTGDIHVEQRSDPSMAFPVKGLSPGAVQSRFGAQRDEGRRSHEGIDIFAPRGTPVVAATDGWVGNSLTNGLGGNVIWISDPLSRIRTYYAHLDRHAASPGQRVQPGDVVGYVGNTGNARGGPPHLHFGVYVAGSGSVDPLPFVCGATCD